MGRCARRGWRGPMKRGDIYLVSLDPTTGHEQSGSRPVLIVSPAEFNEATKLPVILPITNGGDSLAAWASLYQ
jgi:mRNA-degrading endonuclease toxin of MazEF toxin-antitoxin module